MNVNVMAWNVCDGFSDPGRQKFLVGVMLGGYPQGEKADREPDVIAVPEAFNATNQNKLEDDFGAVRDLFAIDGYEAKKAEYNDRDDRPDKHAFLMLSRLPGSLFLRNNMGSRTTQTVLAPDPETGGLVSIVGIHLDDRTLGGRLGQIANLTGTGMTEPGLSNDLHIPTALIGDFNAMHKEDPKARLWRNPFIRALAHSVKAGEPGTKQSKIARAASIGQRVCDMADEAAMKWIMAAGYKEADPTYEPTMPSKKPRFQLDHIMTNLGFVVNRFAVLPDTGLSDHRAISAGLITTSSLLF